MRTEEIQIGDNLDIKYITYTNNGGLRWLKGMEVIGFYTYPDPKFNSIGFKQISTGKLFSVNRNDIKLVYRNK